MILQRVTERKITVIEPMKYSRSRIVSMGLRADKSQLQSSRHAQSVEISRPELQVTSLQRAGQSNSLARTSWANGRGGPATSQQAKTYAP